MLSNSYRYDEQHGIVPNHYPRRHDIGNSDHIDPDDYYPSYNRNDGNYNSSDHRHPDRDYCGPSRDDHEPPATWDNRHDAGCVYGGFSCGYWLISDDCDLDHWEHHYSAADDHCPCGNHFPGAGRNKVAFNRTDPRNDTPSDGG